MEPVHVMVVEDVDQMRSLLTHVLEGIAGITVTGSVRNCFEARLELTRRRPHLVLLDEVLPGESSGDLLVDLLKQGIPVVLLTSIQEPSHEIPPGASSRLSKPGWRSIERDRVRFGEEIRRALTHSPR